MGLGTTLNSETPNPIPNKAQDPKFRVSGLIGPEPSSLNRAPDRLAEMQQRAKGRDGADVIEVAVVLAGVYVHSRAAFSTPYWEVHGTY